MVIIAGRIAEKCAIEDDASNAALRYNSFFINLFTAIQVV